MQLHPLPHKAYHPLRTIEEREQIETFTKALRNVPTSVPQKLSTKGCLFSKIAVVLDLRHRDT